MVLASLNVLSYPIKAGPPALADEEALSLPTESEAEITDCRKIILEGLAAELKAINDLMG